MLNWLKEIFKKRKTNNPCETCVYWKSEMENNIINGPNGKRFCDIYKTFTKPNHTCAMYIEEKFEAQPDSIQSEEKIINHNLSIDRSQLNDVSGEKK